MLKRAGAARLASMRLEPERRILEAERHILARRHIRIAT
jgi:hypothetical protein